MKVGLRLAEGVGVWWEMLARGGRRWGLWVRAENGVVVASVRRWMRYGVVVDVDAVVVVVVGGRKQFELW